MSNPILGVAVRQGSIPLTQSILKEILDYDPETGVFVWKHRNVKWFSVGAQSRATPEGCMKTWNKRYAGKVTGCNDGQGYLTITIQHHRYKAHRLVFLYMDGEMPDYPRQEVDHINHQKHDNRYSNLRIVSRAENSKNLPISKINTSGSAGVHKTGHGLWGASIGVSGNQTHLGFFIKKEDAIKARQEAEIQYNYHTNHGS